MEEIRLKAYGKINIGLDVTGVREDGYHLVKMIMQTVDLCDEVCVSRRTAGITISTDKPFVPADERNIAFKAAEKIAKAFNISSGVHIDIRKNIPVAAGMAGGSADAAAVIKAMDELFGLGMSPEKMDEIATELGADVPFCLRKGTYLAEGIGEKLKKLSDMPHCYALIINPGFGVSTPWAYKQIDAIDSIEHPNIDAMIDAINRKDAAGVAASMGNVLEQAVIPEYKIIGDIKNAMHRAGAMGALMSGSGPTVFGLFDNRMKREEALKMFEGEAYGRFKVEF